MSIRDTIVCIRAAVMLGMLAANAAHAAGPATVALGSADALVILARSGIYNSGASSIAGDVGLSPSPASFISGFALSLNGPGTFASSPWVDGVVFAADYQPPTPALMSAAVGDMEDAYLDAFNRAPADFIGLYGGDPSGRTLAPGLYKWNGGVLISAAGVTLRGGPDDVWIFQVGQDLTLAPQGFLTLLGGAKPTNVFWQVGGKTTLGTMSRMQGIVLGAAQIVMSPGASLSGRALTLGSVTLDSSTVLVGAGDTIFSDGF